MANCAYVRKRIYDLLDGDCTPDELKAIGSHLESCAGCRAEHDNAKLFLRRAAALPDQVPPSRDLWSGIEERLGRHERTSESPSRTWSRPGARGTAAPPRGGRVIALFGAGLAAAAVVVWMVLVPPATPPADPSRWLLLPVEGAPSLEGEPVSSASRFTAGSIVATDGASRAELIHSGIGRLELSPNTIVSFLSAGEGEQRFSLERGTLTASTWVPPRVFIVETAAATAVDMGCAYRLDVADDGTGQLLVTSGLVLLESHGRQSWVPDAALCRMKPGRGPGTPHAEQSSSHFRELLDAFDFDGAPIAPVIDAAADVDAITLWHLLRRAAPADRPAVYSKLAAFVPPPEGVTPEGISRLDDTMLDGWWEEILVSGPRAPGT